MNDEVKDDLVQLKKKQFAPNIAIFEEGDKGDAAYIVLSGKVAIRKGMQSDNPQQLAILGKGEMLGEMALFDDRPRMASAIALTDVTVIEMSRQEFQERLSSVDLTLKAMMLSMVGRVRKMADEFMRRKSSEDWANWEKPE